MQINELRIGNKVGSGNEIITVNEIIESGINPKWGIHDNNPYDEITFDLIYGIPLTEEWLLKFGFERYDELDVNGYLGYKCNQNKGYCIDMYINSKGKCCAHYLKTALSLNHPQYVHQLQNLYFSLTGEELKIKQ